MNRFLILGVISLMLIFPCMAGESSDSTQVKNIQIFKGEVPKEYEETYNNFVLKFTRKNEKADKVIFSTPIPDMYFDLDYFIIDKFPVILANDTYSATQELEGRYKRYKEYHGKTVQANDKMNEERFYQKQDEIKAIYNDLSKNNSDKNYIILTGILSTDNGERIIKDRYVIILDPKYNDREWLEWKIDQNMQKRILLTLSSLDNSTMEFLDSNRELDKFSQKFDNPLIQFILSPIFPNGKNNSIPFFTNK